MQVARQAIVNVHASPHRADVVVRKQSTAWMQPVNRLWSCTRRDNRQCQDTKCRTFMSERVGLCGKLHHR